MVESFEIFADRDSIEPTRANEGTNAARFAMMAALGPGPNSHGVPSDVVVPPDSLESFGLDGGLAMPRGTVSAREHQSREVEFLLEAPMDDWSTLRRKAFDDLNESGTRRARLALLASGLTSSLERESVTAAAAILTSLAALDGAERPPDSIDISGVKEGWQTYCTGRLDQAVGSHDSEQVLRALKDLARVRVDLGLNSADPIVREISLAPFLYHPAETGSTDGSSAPERSSEPRRARAGQVSTMIHGTWGWKDTWWYPGGDFHTYIQREVRQDLYDGGQEFSWSGAFSEEQRILGGRRFHRWATAAGGGHGLHTVFGFSYGSELVARAVNDGALIDEVVLLSAPVHAPHRLMLDMVRRVVDIRLRFDIVLAIARAAQRLPGAANVHEVIIDRPFWSHSVTHDPKIWRELGLAADVGLAPQS